MATIRLDCHSCGRSWDARFLCVDRYERTSNRAVPTDCWPIRWNEQAEDALSSILENRKREERMEICNECPMNTLMRMAGES